MLSKPMIKSYLCMLWGGLVLLIVGVDPSLAVQVYLIRFGFCVFVIAGAYVLAFGASGHPLKESFE